MRRCIFHPFVEGNTFLDWNVMKERLDLLWEEFHLPIWPTEFDWNWHESADFGDHSYHAQVLDSFYRLMFSHQVQYSTVQYSTVHSNVTALRLSAGSSAGPSTLWTLTTRQTELERPI